MALASSIYLFLIFIPLSHGQLNTSPSLAHMTSVPSDYSAQLSSAPTVDQLTSVLSRSSHRVLNTLVNQGNNVSSAVPSPSLSIKWTPAFTDSISGTTASSKTAPSSKQVTSPHLKYSASVLTSQSSQVLASTPAPQQKSSIRETSGPASSMSHTTTVPKPAITSWSISNRVPRASKSKIMPSPAAASLSNFVVNPTSSSVMRNLNSTTVTLNPSSIPTNSSSRIKLNSTVLPGTLSHTSSLVERNLRTSTIRTSTILSTKVMLNSTSSPVAINQTSSFVMPNSSATPAVLNITSSTSKTSANQVTQNFTATSSTFNITSTLVIKSMMSPVILTTQSPKATVFPSYSKAASEASCYTYNNSRTCIRLQPSSTVHYKPTSRGINITTSVGKSGSVFTNVSSMASGGKASSVHQPTPSPGPQDEEETHTTLIVGLAVGLSLGMVLIIIIVVYYRRKRASYQYNVFYDEQNIVMHPFDYSK